jgi:hypothetical protein
LREERRKWLDQIHGVKTKGWELENERGKREECSIDLNDGVQMQKQRNSGKAENGYLVQWIVVPIGVLSALVLWLGLLAWCKMCGLESGEEQEQVLGL